MPSLRPHKYAIKDQSDLALAWQAGDGPTPQLSSRLSGEGLTSESGVHGAAGLYAARARSLLSAAEVDGVWGIWSSEWSKCETSHRLNAMGRGRGAPEQHPPHQAAHNQVQMLFLLLGLQDGADPSLPLDSPCEGTCLCGGPGVDASPMTS